MEHWWQSLSTQKNKHQIGLDFFPSCIIHTAGPKKLKILQLFIIRVADHRFKLEQKFGIESPCAGSSFVPIRFIHRQLNKQPVAITRESQCVDQSDCKKCYCYIIAINDIFLIVLAQRFVPTRQVSYITITWVPSLYPTSPSRINPNLQKPTKSNRENVPCPQLALPLWLIRMVL